MAYSPPLRRKRVGSKIAGVCNGLAQHFDLPVRNVRWAFVFLGLLGVGLSFAIYFVLWILLPEK
ncbi:MAG TPA: PspC domain-containing protein [Flavobacteriales bacterium]|nr:PspC domain-containing protein [Flavobacteriales bacterium]HIO15785.1 PspC domain-containing protein [Flavobacteriales bacterium]